MIQVTAAILFLLCIQCQAAEVKPQDNLDEKKFEGTWYGVVAASNCPMFNEMKKDMTMPTIGFAKDEKMKSSVAFKTPNGCQQMNFIMETVASGHYKYKSDQGENEVMILGTDYTSFAMEYMKTVHEGHVCQTTKLYARKKELPQDIKVEFMQKSQALGLKDEDAVTLPEGDECKLEGY